MRTSFYYLYYLKEKRQSYDNNGLSLKVKLIETLVL